MPIEKKFKISIKKVEINNIEWFKEKYCKIKFLTKKMERKCLVYLTKLAF